MVLRLVRGRAWSPSVRHGRVTIGILVNGRTSFARWYHRNRDHFLGSDRIMAGASVPRFSVSFVIEPRPLAVID